jgi:hypothetical protein
MKRGVLLGLAQAMLVLLVVGRYHLDRWRYPAVWTAAALADPELPVRGRYLSLRLFVDYNGPVRSGFVRCRLTAANGRLVALEDPNGFNSISYFRNGWILDKPVAFFVPEHAPDATRQAAGRELFAKITVIPDGDPRPVQLGVKHGDGLVVLP